MDPSSLKPNKLWIIAAQERERQFTERNKALVTRYDQFTKTLPVLQVGDDVLVQDTDNSRRWSRYGTIVDIDDRRYTIRLHGSGRVVSRNRKFIKPVTIDIANQSGGGDDSMCSSPQIHVDEDDNNVLIDTDSQFNESASRQVNDQPADHTSPVSQEQTTQAGTRMNFVPRMLKNLDPYNRAGLNE